MSDESIKNILPAAPGTGTGTGTDAQDGFSFTAEEKREMAVIQTDISTAYLEAGKLDLQIELAISKKREIQQNIIKASTRLEERIKLSIQARGLALENKDFNWNINTADMTVTRVPRQGAVVPAASVN